MLNCFGTQYLFKYVLINLNKVIRVVIIQLVLELKEHTPSHTHKHMHNSALFGVGCHLLVTAQHVNLTSPRDVGTAVGKLCQGLRV